MGKNHRDNENWIEDLSASGAMQEPALRDLRELIMLGLGRTFFQQGEAFIQDVTQVALLQILRNLNSFAGKSKFSTWAMAIAVRIALSVCENPNGAMFRWMKWQIRENLKNLPIHPPPTRAASIPKVVLEKNCMKWSKIS